MKLMDPSKLVDWLPPHSIAWYQQLSDSVGKYVYPWNSTLKEPNGESIFERDVAQMIVNKKVLDVGCGHGEFTIKCSDTAKEIVGFDITDHFVQVGQDLANRKPNVKFIAGNSKDGLPFKRDEFDCAYIRKGPTSAYPFLKAVVKKDGSIIGLHPGDDSGKELAMLFPNLFEQVKGTPILDTIEKRLASSHFSSTSLENVTSIEFIKTPIDLIKLRCFGQKIAIYETTKEKNLSIVEKIFERNATDDGLPITFSRYLVRISV
ncbi:class I SAM-dependent methyltransferase [Ureibacillus sinduriensis]|uniref:Methyltransferase type 11 n=1 Tax=Ureibacillus sinduriensis BLB-1 = JCM 15800 TaxID=1384057 RepID=A0A0A3HPS7_9BACL|nr:class I SAM-dependent methyltransferase [Ureibacillus sinduriensis]KGR74379.1 methyltransferase type 11 [Ureibacillus sinduriensis BLB-1 = JCM 15800]